MLIKIWIDDFPKLLTGVSGVGKGFHSFFVLLFLLICWYQWYCYHLVNVIRLTKSVGLHIVIILSMLYNQAASIIISLLVFHLGGFYFKLLFTSPLPPPPFSPRYIFDGKRKRGLVYLDALMHFSPKQV